jgi:hypothetical protein
MDVMIALDAAVMKPSPADATVRPIISEANAAHSKSHRGRTVRLQPLHWRLVIKRSKRLSNLKKMASMWLIVLA